MVEVRRVHLWLLRLLLHLLLHLCLLLRMVVVVRWRNKRMVQVLVELVLAVVRLLVEVQRVQRLLVQRSRRVCGRREILWLQRWQWVVWQRKSSQCYWWYPIHHFTISNPVCPRSLSREMCFISSMMLLRNKTAAIGESCKKNHKLPH